jgi:hypothetical protein
VRAVRRERARISNIEATEQGLNDLNPSFGYINFISLKTEPPFGSAAIFFALMRCEQESLYV